MCNLAYELIPAHADRIRLTAVHKIGSNWLTQEVCLEVGRDVNKFECCLAKLTFLWHGLDRENVLYLNERKVKFNE